MSKSHARPWCLGVRVRRSRLRASSAARSWCNSLPSIRARAAEQAGVKVVLYSGGFGALADLAATGAPVADSLAEAVELIDSL